MEHLSLIYMPPYELEPNPWNSNQMDVLNEEKLDESIRQLGFVKPVIVRELDDGTLQILGGEHRCQSAARLGYESIPVTNLGKISDVKAKKIGLVDNGRYGEDDLSLLTDIFKDVGSVEDIMSFFPITEEEISNIFEHDVDIDLDDLGLDELEKDAEEVIDLDEVMTASVKTHQVMRFKVPIEDAQRITDFVERIMSEEGYTESDAMTNAGDSLTHIIFSHDKYGEK